jgi:hypothetical protein
MMEQFIARTNVDHYVSLLNGSDPAHPNRAVITRMLIAEEDKLAHSLEELDFAESRTAQSWDRVNHARKLRDGYAEGSAERASADKRLDSFEAIHRLFEGFCQQLRAAVNAHGL